MSGYYNQTLAAEKLRQAYKCAPPRVKQYLEVEIDHAASYLRPSDTVLELGCGYGRILKELAPKAAHIVGIDTSAASLRAARRELPNHAHVSLSLMNARQLGFAAESFDRVFCLQNGLSAFHVEPLQVIGESIRVTRPGGIILFSSYAEKFWEHRLEWFRRQSQLGLIGPIDWKRTANGEIFCSDGFYATTVSPRQFETFMTALGIGYEISEVDQSSLFCSIQV